METKHVLHHLQNCAFPPAVVTLLSMLEQVPEQIVFVTDHAGLPHYLYLQEEGVFTNRLPHYLYLPNHDTPFLQDIAPIQEAVLSYLAKKEHVLYVYVRFSCTKLTEEDAYSVYQELEGPEQGKKDPEALLQQKRTFPDWYHAQHPKVILREQRNLRILQKAEEKRRLLLQMKWKKDIDHAIEQGEEEEFYRLIELMKKGEY